MHSERMALKPYLDKIVSMCEKLTQEDMLALILSLARKVPLADRSDFLSEIQACIPHAAAAPDIPSDAIEALVEQVSDLEESIFDRIESIENGEYWDEEDHWDYGYEDEDPEDLSQDHMDELRALFHEAGDLFLNGLLAQASQIYTALFELIGKLSERDAYFHPEDLDLREERARYCRCILETGNGTLTGEFVKAMEVEAQAEDTAGSRTGKYPLIQDIIDTRSETINDLQSFFKSWRDFLPSRDIKLNRTADLYLEAVLQLEGLEAVAELAGSWKQSQPRGYVFWIGRLVEEKKWEAAITAAQSALSELPAGKYREKVADYLIEAATAIDDGKMVLTGKRERFFSRVCDENVKDLIAEAVSQNKRETELETVLKVIGAGKKSEEEKSILVRLLLMAGRLKSAFDMVKNEPGIGWSEGNAGVVFGGILSTTAGRSEKAITIQNLIQDYSCRSTAYSYRIHVREKEDVDLFCREILVGLKNARSTGAEMSEMLLWAMKIGKKRIDEIVSNKRRGAYHRAAEVLGCLAETLALTGKTDESRKLIHTYYAEKYNRFSAFRSEVKNVVSQSPVLRGLGLRF